MSNKIYLSPALHGIDNPTKCPMDCSENTHCGQYMDIVEKRLKDHGFSVKRGGPATGTQAMYDRVAESNEWGAELHYAAHTNGGGGRYSMTMCYDGTNSKRAAEFVGKNRKNLPPDSWHKVVVTNDLYELAYTNCAAVYDELVFHDNAEDCAWFHKNMELMAEDTVKAFCEYFGVEYKEKAKEEKSNVIFRIQVGAFIEKKNAISFMEQLKRDGYDPFLVEVKQ